MLLHILYDIIHVHILNEVIEFGVKSLPPRVIDQQNPVPELETSLLVIGVQETPKTIKAIAIVPGCLLELEGKSPLLEAAHTSKHLQ